MSADNYYFVRQRGDGKYDVTHRFASAYYSDEGWTKDDPPTDCFSLTASKKGWQLNGTGPAYATPEEAEATAIRHPEWIESKPDADISFDTLGEAVMYAHKCVAEDDVVEYGVIIQTGLVWATKGEGRL